MEATEPISARLFPARFIEDRVMSQVPNRYYNSPWIADAAKNLSLAIAGDPERDAARLSQKRTEMLMKREEEKAALEAQDRAKAETFGPMLANIFGAPKEAQPAMITEALRNNLPPSAVYDVSGANDPRIAGKIAIQDPKLSSALEIANIKLTSAEEREKARLEEDRRNHDFQHGDRQLGITTRATTAANALSFKEKALAAKDAKGDSLLKISPDEFDDLDYEIKRFSRPYGAQLDPQLHQDVLIRASQYMQQTRNAGTAIQKAFSDLVHPEDATVEPGTDPWFGDPTPAILRPRNPRSREWMDANPVGAQRVLTPPSAPTPAMPNGNLSGVFMNPAAQGASLFGEPLAPQFGPRAMPGSQPAPAITPAPPAAEQYLRKNATPQMKAAFQSKYGYLPQGL
jgi:hypothetical protein